MSGVRDEMAALYDVFVDWEGRLAREVPGLLRRLEEAGARRVLDVGCGTGRHVRALREAGLEVHGADASEDMLARARALLGDAGLHRWTLGAPPPAGLAAAAPFDAVVGLGNVWPQVAGVAEERAAAEAMRDFLRPGGMLLLAFKAVALRREQGAPYLPLLRRERNGRPHWFVRFLDLEHPPLADGTPVAGFRMLALDEERVLADERGRWRVWSVDELVPSFERVGFRDVLVTSGLAGDEPPTGEDVLLLARRGG